MTKPIPSYLKLLADEPRETPASPPRDEAGVERLSAAFAEATGWTLTAHEAQHNCQFDPWSAPVNPGVGIPPGSHAVELGAAARPDARPRVGKQAASRLAEEIGRLLDEIRSLQQALCRREAELAAGVPIIPHRTEDAHLAARLHGVLKGGVEAVGCTAAALYLLDDATSELKLRSAFGLPMQSLLQPARPLRGSLADLEALLGHAVVLDDALMFDTWRAPHDIEYAAAVCVPVSSPTIPLGTLWFFSAETRDFSERDTNLIEIIAGRLAADLERTMLLQSTAVAVRAERNLDLAEDAAVNEPPIQSPQIDGWKFGGGAAQGDACGGAFYDWWTTASGTTFFSVGNANQNGWAGATAAAALRSTLRAHSEYLSDPAEILNRANRALWSARTGDQPAQAWLGCLDAAAGGFRYAAAGQIGLSIVAGNEIRPMRITSPELGGDPDASFASRLITLEPAHSLIICTEPAAAIRETPLGKDLFDWSKAILRQTDANGKSNDRAALVVHRLANCKAR